MKTNKPARLNELVSTAIQNGEDIDQIAARLVAEFPDMPLKRAERIAAGRLFERGQEKRLAEACERERNWRPVFLSEYGYD